MHNTAIDKLAEIDRDVHQRSTRKSSDTLRVLSDLLEAENIAEELTDEELIEVGKIVSADYAADFKSMDKWIDNVERGLDLIELDMDGRDDPWPGAANFKTSRPISAALQFGDRATSELMPDDEIVKTQVYGKDPGSELQEKAKRVACCMNYVLQRKMKGWKEQTRKILYMQPNVGATFKRVFYDSTKQKIESRMIPFGQFVVDNKNTVDGDLHRFSENFFYKKTEIIRRQKLGYWREYDGESISSANGGDEGEEVDKAVRQVVEQYTWLDLDDDGIEEPYSVTIDHHTKHVYRIDPLFNRSTVYIKPYKKEGDEEPEKITLKEYYRMVVEGEYDDPGAAKDVKRFFKDYSVCYIDAMHGIVKYPFIKDPMGGYLDVGLLYMICSLSASSNKLMNQMLNVNDIAQRGGGFLASNFADQESGPMDICIAEWKHTSIGPGQLQNSIFPFPNRDVAPVALELLKALFGDIDLVTSSYDLSKIASMNTPATTLLAILGQQESQHGAVIKGIFDAMTEEFLFIKKIISSTMTDAEYQRIVNDENATIAEDFNEDLIDVFPVANPEASSRTQRLQIAEAEFATVPLYMQMEEKDKANEVLKSYFSAIGSDLKDKIYPTLTPEQQQQIQQQQEQQEAELKEKQERLEALNAELAASTADLNTATATERRAKVKVEMDKQDAEIRKIESEIVKNVEQAESEQVKNNIDTYKAIVDGNRQTSSSSVSEQ